MLQIREVRLLRDASVSRCSLMMDMPSLVGTFVQRDITSNDTISSSSSIVMLRMNFENSFEFLQCWSLWVV